MSKPKSNSSPNDQLQSIDPTALARVSGGTTTTTTTATSGDQVLTALNGILDSIHSLANQNNNNGGLNPQEMLMFMVMMQQRNQQQAAVATTAWPWSQQPIIRYY